MKKVYLLSSILLILISCQSQPNKIKTMDSLKTSNQYYNRTEDKKVNISNDVWKNILSTEVYNVARQKGTERPGTSVYEHSKEIGTFYCAVCGNALFKSDTKFESGCGWPSFYEPISKTSLINTPDNSHGMRRTEVQCGKCESHLGHVFEDGPPPTGLRYCINGVVLDFGKSEAAKKGKE